MLVGGSLVKSSWHEDLMILEESIGMDQVPSGVNEIIFSFITDSNALRHHPRDFKIIESPSVEKAGILEKLRWGATSVDRLAEAILKGNIDQCLKELKIPKSADEISRIFLIIYKTYIKRDYFEQLPSLKFEPFTKETSECLELFLSQFEDVSERCGKCWGCIAEKLDCEQKRTWESYFLDVIRHKDALKASLPYSSNPKIFEMLQENFRRVALNHACHLAGVRDCISREAEVQLYHQFDWHIVDHIDFQETKNYTTLGGAGGLGATSDGRSVLVTCQTGESFFTLPKEDKDAGK